MQDFQRGPFLLEGNTRSDVQKQFTVFLSSLALMFAAEREAVGCAVEQWRINLPQYQGN